MRVPFGMSRAAFTPLRGSSSGARRTAARRCRGVAHVGMVGGLAGLLGLLHTAMGALMRDVTGNPYLEVLEA